MVVRRSTSGSARTVIGGGAFVVVVPPTVTFSAGVSTVPSVTDVSMCAVIGIAPDSDGPAGQVSVHVKVRLSGESEPDPVKPAAAPPWHNWTSTASQVTPPGSACTNVAVTAVPLGIE